MSELDCTRRVIAENPAAAAAAAAVVLSKPEGMVNSVVPDKRTKKLAGCAAAHGDARPQPRGLALYRPARAAAADTVDALQCWLVRREITTRFIGSENSCARMRLRRRPCLRETLAATHRHDSRRLATSRN